MKIVNIILLICLGTFVLACKRKNNTCIAGNGGSATIVAFPKHHGKSIRPYNAYVKFNSKDAPSSLSDYDLKLVADTTEDHIELTNLKCGEYYIYLNGYDTLSKAVVKGGLPYTLKESISGEVNVDIAVTE